MVVHIQTSQEAINDFLNLISQLAAEKREAGFKPEEYKPPQTNGLYKDPYVRKDSVKSNV